MDDNKEKLNQAAFFGGEDVELSREINGKKTVKVKCLPVRKLAEYAALIDNEPEIIELTTDLTVEEVDMLSVEDSGNLFRKAHELNFDPFSDWLKRKAEALKLKAQAYGIQQTNGKDSTGSSAGSAPTAQ
ncbi:MAG: hypothetical protein IKS15_04690 [Opitutales bacterium]|nr:hypothetical protein [Opitutales bacterium]